MEEARSHLEGYARRLESSADRLAAAVATASDGRLAEPLPPSGWDASQIVRHMLAGNEEYLKALSALPPGRQGPLERTWLGRKVEEFAGEKGDRVKVPAAFLPGPPEPTRPAAAELDAQIRSLYALAKRFGEEGCHGLRMRNPVFHWFKMTVPDAFAVLAAHTERHVGQIERGVRQP